MLPKRALCAFQFQPVRNAIEHSRVKLTQHRSTLLHGLRFLSPLSILWFIVYCVSIILYLLTQDRGKYVRCGTIVKCEQWTNNSLCTVARRTHGLTWLLLWWLESQRRPDYYKLPWLLYFFLYAISDSWFVVKRYSLFKIKNKSEAEQTEKWEHK